jgi:hypothetical protein
MMATKLTPTEIEDAIFAQLYPERLKVAWLVGHAFPIAGEQPNEADINAALLRLQVWPNVESYGNVTKWRSSEMRRVESKT